MPMLPGTQRDVLTISRPVASGDSEGNFTSGIGSAMTVMGTWGSASANEQQQAAQRGQTIDSAAIMPSGTDVQPGDVVTAEGHTWVVVDTRDVRIHQRVLLRETA